ncbi:MAG: hypothetical protein Q9219_000145 [cf. Caloplaca sp. 3 TL-2023]
MIDNYHEPEDLLAPSAAYNPGLLDSQTMNLVKEDNFSKIRDHGRLGSGKAMVSDRNSGDSQARSTLQIDGDGSPERNPGDQSTQSSVSGSVEASHPTQEEPSADTSTVKHRSTVERLQVLLQDEASPHNTLFEAYSQLPSPGMEYLSEDYRDLLFHRLSVVRRKTREGMLRYLTLVDHMKEASLPLKQSQWTTAIAYAGRCLARVEAPEVELALRIWKEMEQEAGVRSGKVTFNILFDIATKAGKYVLADMIHQEMKARGLEYSRFSYTGFIYYHGVRGDGAGVRKAYRDFVEAGQIVDTVVLNCVIVSLIRAGEPSAAERVYERMKRLSSGRTDRKNPTLDWRASRDLGRALEKLAKIARNDKQRLQGLQAEQCLAPDLWTFCIFLDYHIHTTGELHRVIALLGEMRSLRLPMDGRIFLRIFKGFAYHGGVKYTSWTWDKLELVWTSLLSFLEQEMEGTDTMKWMVIWAVRAFFRCSGKDRTLQVWDEIKDRWKTSGEDEKDVVEHKLRDILDIRDRNRSG